MGLIKAGIGALGGVLADQWKEFFTCDSLDKDVLIKRGTKNINSRSSNTKGNDNVISNGSGIVVADGQCMIISEQGKIVEVCAEPGEYTYDTSTEPSIFAGSLGDSIINTFKTIGKRFTFGGDPAKDQRVYYINIKELIDNKFGTPNPVPFRVVDSKIGLDLDVSVMCSGIYSYKIVDPLKFYTNISGNIRDEYPRSELDPQLKTEFISALAPSFAKLSNLEIRPNQIIAHTTELEEFMNDTLSEKWGELRGLKVVSVAFNPIILPQEDQELIKEAQRVGMLRRADMAGATLVGAQADAMKAAASNDGGAMTGFLGMGMAMNTGAGMNAQAFYQQAQKEQQPSPNAWKCSCGTIVEGNFCPQCGAKKPQTKPSADEWTCTCGVTVKGNFCPECGAKRPENSGWTCSCGAVNKGKFCSECGAKKPAGAPLYRCDKCGWEPEDPTHPPKFCPECGDMFDDSDKQ